MIASAVLADSPTSSCLMHCGLAAKDSDLQTPSWRPELGQPCYVKAVGSVEEGPPL